MKSVTRRSFLKTSAAVATLSVARQAAAAPSRRIRVAIIGLNNRGPQVADSLLKTEQFDIVSLCDCDSAKFDKAMPDLQKSGLKKTPKFVKDFRKVLDDKKVDAIVNATPDHWHAMLTVMALDAGKHVYLEKPMSYNIQDGKAIVAAQEKHPKLRVLVGSQQRSGKHFAETKEFIKSGALGKIGFCRAWVTHRRDLLPAVPDSDPPATLDYDMWLGPAPKRPYNANRVHYNWRFIRDYGTGEMGNWGAHWIDVPLWLLDLGYPKSVVGYGGQYVVHDAKEWPDTQTIMFEYPDLTFLWELRLWTDYQGLGVESAAEFAGEKGTLIVSARDWVFYPAKAEPQKHGGSEQPIAHARNFADAIRGDAKPAVALADSHKTAVLCHMANIATDLNRKLDFDGATQSFVNDTEANKLLGRPYRTPWRLPE